MPDRDIIMALTADEEGGPQNGVEWLLENRRDLIDAEYALNEGGGGALKDGVRQLNKDLTSAQPTDFRPHPRTGDRRQGHLSVCLRPPAPRTS